MNRSASRTHSILKHYFSIKIRSFVNTWPATWCASWGTLSLCWSTSAYVMTICDGASGYRCSSLNHDVLCLVCLTMNTKIYLIVAVSGLLPYSDAPVQTFPLISFIFVQTYSIK